MCDPITLAGIALSGASMVANSISQSKIQSARDDAMAAERIRQQGYDKEADALNSQSQNRYQNIEGQQGEKSKQLGDYFKKQSAPAAPDTANQQTTMPASSSNLTIANENTQRARAQAYTDQQGQALGNLRSFGDLLGGIGRDQARDAMAIGQIGGFKKGSSAVLPMEMEAANSAGGGMGMLGDVLGGAGGIAVNAGLSGKGLFGIGGASAAKPAAAKAAGGVPSFAAGNSLYSLYSPYATGGFRS